MVKIAHNTPIAFEFRMYLEAYRCVVSTYSILVPIVQKYGGSGVEALGLVAVAVVC